MTELLRFQFSIWPNDLEYVSHVVLCSDL